jgi:hypothetical protein
VIIKNNHRFFLAFVLVLMAYEYATPQTPFLERTMTISFQQERLDVVLRRISAQGGFTFSYSPSILEAGKIITADFTNKTVREILDQLFSGTLQYKARGKYIILTKAQLSRSKESQILTGYIVDEATGERLKDVTVYDPVTLSSTLTDSYGYFEIRVDKPRTDLKLAINKKNYSDTVVVTAPKNGRLLNIRMKESTEKISTFADSVGKKIKRFWTTKVMAHKSNVTDTIYRKSQFSVLPFIGTNHLLSGSVINDYSLNMIGGYSLGVKKLEFGGVFNIVEGHVGGAQLAGVFNAAGGSVEGVQMAGVFNASGGTVKGAQLAGVFNVSGGDVEGVQLAGVFNFTLKGRKHFAAAGVLNFSGYDTRAVQLAGMMNVTIGEQESPHLAGLFNFTTGNAKSQVAGIYNFSARSMQGWQNAGVFNFAAKDAHGLQTGGILNFSGGRVRGAQVAGILNFAGREVRGAQVAGILNYATKIRGVQIGLVNIADSVKGVPIGLMSVVLSGYHKLEISADEIFYTNASIRTGVRQFYNILQAGAKPATLKDTATHWYFGYGIGTAPRLSRNLFLNFDLTSSQIVQGGENIEKINLLNKFYVGVDYQVSKNFSITAGATLNAYITDTSYDGYRNIFNDYKPSFMVDHTYRHDNVNLKMWVGGKIGLRFF